MPKRKKTAVKRTRRSPYERSLEHATRRLEKAMDEQMECRAKLDSLEQEIPYLQGIIRALTPTESVEISPGVYTRQVTADELGDPNLTVADQEGFLSRFVKPVRAVPTVGGQVLDRNLNDETEQFLPDKLPGFEVLP